MSGNGDSQRPKKRRVDGEAKAVFLAALRGGADRDEAAAAAGFSANAFYYAKKRDAVFAQAWRWALDLSARDQRSAAAAAAPPEGDYTIAPNANRALQRRPLRRRLFDDASKRIFLDHFATTADVRAAAAAAGVSVSAVTQHRLRDPVFDAACEEVLGHAYKQLHAEALRQRLEAQRNLLDGLCPAGEVAAEFDRIMQLLHRFDRLDGRIGTRAVGRGQERRLPFDDSIGELDRHLRALGVRHGVESEPIPPRLPAPDEENGKPDEGEG